MKRYKALTYILVAILIPWILIVYKVYLYKNFSQQANVLSLIPNLKNSSSLLKHCTRYLDTNGIHGQLYISGPKQNTITIRTSGSLDSKLKSYNALFTCLSRLFGTLAKKTSSDYSSFKMLFGNGDDLLQTLELNHPDVYGVILANDDEIDLRRFNPNTTHVANYYHWTAEKKLCKWINTYKGTKARYDVVYNKSCYEELEQAAKTPERLNPLYLYGKPVNRQEYWPKNERNPSWYYTRYPNYIFYHHVFFHALVLPTGEVITSTLKFTPIACYPNHDRTPPSNYNRAPRYRHLVVVAQFWGGAYFHKHLEVLPRLAPLLGFVRQNPNVKVLMPEIDKHTVEIMGVLGVRKDQLVSGLVRADIVYLPQSTPCGYALLRHVQVLSAELRSSLIRPNSVTKHITNVLKPKVLSKQNLNMTILKQPTNLENSQKNFVSVKERKRTVLQIRRSRSRYFTQRDEITKSLKRLASEFGYDFRLFIDNPSPTLRQTAEMFDNAVLVVAPHGAGLANLLYARPGTFVIEGVCNRPHVNLCFTWAAHTLGHRYHGIASRGGCEHHNDVDHKEVEKAARIYLHLSKLN